MGKSWEGEGREREGEKEKQEGGRTRKNIWMREQKKCGTEQEERALPDASVFSEGWNQRPQQDASHLFLLYIHLETAE